MLVSIAQVTPFLPVYPKNIKINIRTMEILRGKLSAEKNINYRCFFLFVSTENNLLGQQEGWLGVPRMTHTVVRKIAVEDVADYNYAVQRKMLMIQLSIKLIPSVMYLLMHLFIFKKTRRKTSWKNCTKIRTKPESCN